jgi:hypothetical protein
MNYNAIVTAISGTRKKITAEIRGGIGNQLFIYCAGAYLASRSGSSLYLNMFSAEKGIKLHGDSILSFRTTRGFNTSKNFSHGFLTKAQFKISRNQNFIFRLFSKYISRYESRGLGYDPTLDNLPSLNYLKGYFQSYKYYRYLLENDTEFVDFEPAFSCDFLDRMSERIDFKISVAVHVRLGDYRDWSDYMGLLSSDYYESSLSLIEGFFGDKNFEVYVFSNDVDGARSILQNLDYKFNWVDFDSSIRASETMLLFSKFNYKVIANSTFSMWGALLGKKEQMVICPSKWYRGMQDPVELLPPEWCQIESRWL